MSVATAAEEDALVCRPLDSLSELLSSARHPPAWRALCTDLQPHSPRLVRNMEVGRRPEDSATAPEPPHAFCHLQPDEGDARRHDEGQLPRTLVCHDMANGYHDDSKIQGSSAHDAYTFYNWAGVDIFCYFSHHLITIPPVSWINVAHKHGVKVIGTVITEWAEGTEFWRHVLASEGSAREVADALVAIASALSFDGWLLNVENKVSDPEKLVQFVRQLHTALQSALGDRATLLWYDSVTVEGHLSWQNKLNDKNRAFFDACDGLFTNYSWQEGDVAESAAAAGRGGRRRDLFVGVDVWGRNFHGGGQLNTKEAVRLVHKHGCSMAIFAPAWTHEAMPDAEERKDPKNPNAILMSSDLDQYECFLVRDRALWGSLWPFLNTRVPSALPFQTSFCRGQGRQRRVYGEVFSPGPWYNLRHQQYQPNAAPCPRGYLLATPASLAAGGGALGLREALHRTGGASPPSLEHKLQEVLLKCCSEKHRVEEPGGEEGQAGAEEGAPGACTDSVICLFKKLSVGQSAAGGLARPVLAFVAGELACLEPCFEDSFTGGSCLRVHPSDPSSPHHRTTRLWFSEFPCSHSLVACVVTKPAPGHERQFLNVVLTGTDEEGKERKVTLVGRDLLEGTSQCSVPPLRAGQPAWQRVQRHLLRHEPAFYVPVENAFGWSVRYYEVDLSGCLVTGVWCRLGLPAGPMLLGHFGLCKGPPPPPYAGSPQEAQSSLKEYVSKSNH